MFTHEINRPIGFVWRRHSEIASVHFRDLEIKRWHCQWNAQEEEKFRNVERSFPRNVLTIWRIPSDLKSSLQSEWIQVH